VRFNHSDHFDLRRPDCASCHTGLFGLTAEGQTAREAARTEDAYHEARCGTCHNGDDAFDTEDDCALCHAE
jgi:c(7)-type cytochrome triheme protein